MSRADVEDERWTGDPHDGEPAVHPGGDGEVPGARDIRRYTVAAGNQRGGADVGQLLGSVYYVVVVSAIAVGIALGLTSTLRIATPSNAATAGAGLDLPLVALALVVALAGVLLALAGRLGPVGVGGAEANWWLSLPVDRQGLLRPAALRLPVVGLLLGAVLVPVLDAGLVGTRGAALVRSGLLGGLAALLLVLLAALAQTFGVDRRVVARVGEVLAVLGAVVVVGLGLLGRAPDGLPDPGWVGVAVLVAAVAVLGVVVDRRLTDVPGRSLRESGSVATQAAGAVTSLDSRELGRVLTDAGAAPRRRRSSRLRTATGPASAVVTADLVVLRRSGRHLVQLVLTAGLPWLATRVPGLEHTGIVAIVLLVAAGLAASATAEGARRAEMVPSLDRLLPLGAAETRRLRLVVPALVLLLWGLVATAALGAWTGQWLGWAAMAVALAPAWAATAVRAAYRAAPDWGGALVSSPMGALPTGVMSVVSRGPDVLVLGTLPASISVLLGYVHPYALVAQVVLSLIVVRVASNVETRSLMERLQDAAREAEEQRR